MPDDTLATIQRRLIDWSTEYADLPLYAAITRHAAGDDAVAALLQSAGPGQARPVLLLAALHELVLEDPSVPAARWYPHAADPLDPTAGDPWPDVRRTLLEYADRLRGVIATRSTQTNEVNRTVYLAALLHLACADLRSTSVALLEIGASAGLLLGIERYRTTVTSPGDRSSYGPVVSPVRCEGADHSRPPLRALHIPPIESARGLDLNPVDLRDSAAVRWLAACLWPEVPGRYERFAAAVELLREDPPAVDRGDMEGDLPGAIEQSDTHLVLFSSWAVTYVDPASRARIGEHLAAAAHDGRPVSWVAAEPPGAVPGIPLPDRLRGATGGTVLSARRWREGRELPPTFLGTAHPHGRWIDLERD